MWATLTFWLKLRCHVCCDGLQFYVKTNRSDFFQKQEDDLMYPNMLAEQGKYYYIKEKHDHNYIKM